MNETDIQNKAIDNFSIMSEVCNERDVSSGVFVKFILGPDRFSAHVDISTLFSTFQPTVRPSSGSVHFQTLDTDAIKIVQAMLQATND